MKTAPDDALSCTLAVLEECWLVVECANRHMGLYPLRLLGMRQGRNKRLRDILPRCRCRYCKLPPSVLLLNERPYTTNAGMGGYNVVGWSVDLLNPALHKADMGAPRTA